MTKYLSKEELDALNEERVQKNRENLHPSFRALHEKGGSGYYWFATKLGMGTVFYLSSREVHVYNPNVTTEDVRMGRLIHEDYDFYDALRAVETGHVRSMKDDVFYSSGEVMEKDD